MIKAIPLSNFCNRHQGERGTVVGRGPTSFDYRDLKQREGPVFFLNDAVQLECHTTGPAYFFALDNQMLRLLTRKLKAVPVLPRDFEQMIVAASYARDQELSIVFYECDRTPRERLLLLSRGELSALGEIYNGTVTILSALHFLWYCGCDTVDFIGCDGINHPDALRRIGDPQNGYDRRLGNISNTHPAWKYDRIREEQDRVCRALNLATRYLGTPERPHSNPFRRKQAVIPRLAHFVWLGGAMPDFMLSNINRFRQLHPDWQTVVWHGIPDQVPDDLRQACLRQGQLCLRSAMIRTWLLRHFGGLYLAGDVYPVRPFDELLHFEHFVGGEPGGQAGTHCAMGSAPGSAFIDNLLSRIRAVLSTPSDQWAGSALGPRRLTEFVHGYPGLVNLLPDHYFCPFQNHEFAFALTRKQFPEIHRELVRQESRFVDGVWPYGIQTDAIPAI